MPNQDDPKARLSAILHAGDVGSLLRVLGWCLLLMAALTSVWIWTGWRAGTWFWFWWTGGFGAGGTGMVAAGSLLRAHAAKDYAALSGDLSSRSASPAEAAGQLPDSERRAA
jgi:hypothetical protein